MTDGNHLNYQKEKMNSSDQKNIQQNVDYKKNSQQNNGNVNNSDHKNKTAIALTYYPEEAAPRIVATGKGFVADKILQTAKESHVPVHKDEKLAGTLSKLSVGDYIPPELYEVVSEILVFVDDMDRIKKKIKG